MKNKKILLAILLTAWVYGLLGWIYIVINSEVHMQTLSMPLTHLASFPREDTFGIICFFVSVVSFFFWNLLRDN